MNNLISGMYAIKDLYRSIHYYKIDIPKDGKWKGYVFVSAQASDKYYPIKDIKTKKNILDILRLDPLQGMALYGQTIGQCAICGKTLTDDESRKRGIGPICWAKKI
jgi:hypothetical protein